MFKGVIEFVPQRKRYRDDSIRTLGVGVGLQEMHGKPATAQRVDAAHQPNVYHQSQAAYIFGIYPQVVLVHMGYRSEEHTSELQSHLNLVCRLLLEKKKKQISRTLD